MGLAEGVTASNQRDRFFVIHRHACEGFANIPRRSDRIRVAVRPFRIHVDQAHLNGGERIIQLTVARVALVRQPLALGAPIDVLFGLPGIHRARRRNRRS